MYIPISGNGAKGITKVTINAMEKGIECGDIQDQQIGIANDGAILTWGVYKYKSTGSIKLSIVKEITDGQLKTIYNN